MNNRYKLTAQAPLLRPGLSLSTTVSKRYVKDAQEEMMDLVRQINSRENA